MVDNMRLVQTPSFQEDSMMRAAKLGITVSLISVLTMAASDVPAVAQFNWGALPGMVDVDARQQQMEQDINQAAAQGQLTAQSATSFRSELNRIKQIETQFRADGKLSIWERTRLMFELDNLQKEIDAGLTPRTSGLTDMAGREAEIAAEISDALFTGRLTKPEADSFRSELDRIKARESTLKQDGSLNSNEVLTLSLELDQLQRNVHSKSRPLVVSDPAINSKKAEIAQRIAQLHTRGRITPAELEQLKQELQRIETKQTAFEASGSRIDTNESLTLAIELERLAASLERYQTQAASAPAAGINARQERVEKMISDALLSGKLTSQQVLDLKSEFDRIAALEANFRADGELFETETLTLSRDLENLQTRVERISADIGAPGGGPYGGGRYGGGGYGGGGRYGDGIGSGGIGGGGIGAVGGRPGDLGGGPSIDARMARMRRRVSDAEMSGQFNPRQVQELRTQLNRLEDRKRYFEVDGILTDSEVLTLTSDLDELKMGMDRLATATPPPDDNAPRRSAINAKQTEIRRKITDATSSGKLKQSDNSELMREFDRIKNMEADFARSENSLSDSEVSSLVHDLDRLEGDLSRAIASASTPPPVAIDTSGVSPDTRGHWAEQYVALLSRRGTIGGFPDGTFKPNDYITRAQFAAIASRALSLPPAGRHAEFKDVPQKYWAANAISQVSDAGLVTGFPDGTFRPEDKITRAQALVILAKALHSAGTDAAALGRYRDNTAVPAWARPSVVKAANAGIIVNHPDPAAIRPNDTATRAEIAALTYQTMARLGESLPQIRVGLEATGQ
jgi:hypothetical protein